MSSTAIDEVVKMMEDLPADVQHQLLEHLREYIHDFQDKKRWDESFEKTQAKLVAAAKHAK